MGKSEMINAQPDVVDGFLSKVSAAQASLIHAINSNEPLRAAFAEAEAKMILLEHISPEVGAYLLRFCDQRLGMVELVGDCNNDSKVQVMALAILNGFVPGRSEFGIFQGKLYVKENGYRSLFTKLRDCGPPDVLVGHPDLKDLGNGKRVWTVDGTATVRHRGEECKVECSGKYAIGIPAHGSDNVDGIKSKARRRLLQLLWRKVSSIGIDDTDDTIDGPAGVEVIDASPKQITQQTEPESKPDTSHPVPLPAAEQHKATGQAIIRMLSSDPSAASTAEEIWKAMTGAKTASDLTTICDEYRPLLVGFSDTIQAKFRKYKAALLRELTDAEGLLK